MESLAFFVLNINSSQDAREYYSRNIGRLIWQDIYSHRNTKWKVLTWNNNTNIMIVSS